MRPLALAAALLLAGCIQVAPESVPSDVCGFVTGPDGAPVAVAAVTANRRGHGHGTTTDAAGHFCLGRLMPGTYSFGVAKDGFQPHSSTLKVPHPENLTIELAAA